MSLTKALSELDRAISNPRAAAKAFLKRDAELRLIDFIRLTWHVLEPGQPLRVGKAMEAIAEHLEALHKGQIRNLLINCPPGFSKSTLVNVFFPAWEWGPKNRPDLRYISWAYGEHLTVRDNEKCQKLINSALYQSLWGGRFDWNPRQNAKGYYKTNHEGFRIASGVRGMGTGERADRLVIDDPLDASGAQSEAERLFAHNWFNGTLTTRVRNSNPFTEVVDGVLVEPSRGIMIMQRLHHMDPSGIILEEELAGWEHLLIEMEYEGDEHPARKRISKKTGKPAWKKSAIGYVDWREAQIAEVEKQIADFNASAAERDTWWGSWGLLWLGIAQDISTLADPTRFSRAAVEELKERLMLTIGSNAVAAQLRQWPSEGSGDMFKPENWEFCDPKDVPKGRTLYDVRGWDLAASEDLRSDGTGAVLIRWGADKRFYIMHAERVRMGPGGVREFRDRIRAMDGPGVIQDFPQDPGQAGVDQVRAIMQEAPGIITQSSPETGKKTTRAMPASSFQERKMIVIVRGPWNREYIEELADFPNGKFSALVDGTSRAFNRLAAMPQMMIPGGAEVLGGMTQRQADMSALGVGSLGSRMPVNPAISRPEIDDDLDFDD